MLAVAFVLRRTGCLLSKPSFAFSRIVRRRSTSRTQIVGPNQQPTQQKISNPNEQLSATQDIDQLNHNPVSQFKLYPKEEEQVDEFSSDDVEQTQEGRAISTKLIEENFRNAAIDQFFDMINKKQ